jgi:NAD(P)-dependent dehydrogenase (short-subunit alcohol dehydrogenase family)
MRLKDQVAVVTGAAGGIGRALCRELNRAGMRLTR